ncbi:MAG: DUF1080 domain-containing protein [Verrucomicrobiota bacterium]
MRKTPWFPACAAIFIFFTGCVSKNPPVAQPKSASPPSSNPVAQAAIATKPVEIPFFNGKDLSGWKQTDFGAHGDITVKDGVILLNMGAELTGIHWTNAAALPKTDYEIELDAMKRDGNDFFCALTFPVSNSFCSLIVGGWGGGVVGISSLDGGDASENDTSKSLFFERNRWYHIRLQVRPQKILVWIDEDKVVDVGIAGRKVAMRSGEIELSMPLGIATWQTSASLKNLRLKTLSAE